jgi:hypothetical protein
MDGIKKTNRLRGYECRPCRDSLIEGFANPALPCRAFPFRRFAAENSDANDNERYFNVAANCLTVLMNVSVARVRVRSRR